MDDLLKPILCTLCDKDAITTAAGIPVCENHDREYQEEGRQYLAHRPFYDRLLRVYQKHGIRRREQ